MSTGPFIETVYIADNDDNYPIRVQPETITAFNPAAVGSILPNTPSANASGGIRRNGVNARRARFRVIATTTSGISEGRILTIPIMTLASFNLLAKLTNYTYIGGTLRLVGKTGERIR